MFKSVFSDIILEVRFISMTSLQIRCNYIGCLEDLGSMGSGSWETGC